jgi:ferredoxin
MPKVVTYLCPQNHPCPCVKVCAVKALTQKGNAAPVIDMAICTKCGKCVKVCPMGAVQKD